MAHDLVIRGGLLVDGTGAPARKADIGIQGGKIAEVGEIKAQAGKQIDAAGLLVTPGFIDVHTHFDAQINWDPLATPASWHGITTAIMGNCGFTLAPVRKNARELVLRCLERAEDISAKAMELAIDWNWESFPQYLDTLEKLPKGIDFGVYCGHSALRTWAMGERAFDGPSGEEDMKKMELALQEAMRAGAMGFSTSRSNQHETSDDRPVASRMAQWEEVRRLVMAMSAAGGGVFELALETHRTDRDKRHEFHSRLQKLALASNCPITFGLTPATAGSTEVWQERLRLLSDTSAKGGRMIGQSNSKDPMIILSFKTQLPFDKLPQWKELRAKPLEEQKRLLRDPETRRRLVRIVHEGPYGHISAAEAPPPQWDMILPYDRPMPPYRSLAELAAERGTDPAELMIEMSLERDFDCYFLQRLVPEDLPGNEQIMRHPGTIMTFSDSGAHVGQISDCSIATHLLAYWVRERKALELEQAVGMITQGPAQLFGLADRGRIAPGMKADLNLIEFDRLMPEIPQVAADIPGGSKRLIQQCTGMQATLVDGQVIVREGKATGALPGKLLRGGSSRRLAAT